MRGEKLTSYIKYIETDIYPLHRGEFDTGQA